MYYTLDRQVIPIHVLVYLIKLMPTISIYVLNISIGLYMNINLNANQKHLKSAKPREPATKRPDIN